MRNCARPCRCSAICITAASRHFAHCAFGNRLPVRVIIMLFLPPRIWPSMVYLADIFPPLRPRHHRLKSRSQFCPRRTRPGAVDLPFVYGKRRVAHGARLELYWISWARHNQNGGSELSSPPTGTCWDCRGADWRCAGSCWLPAPSIFQATRFV